MTKPELVTIQFAKMLVKFERLLRQLSGQDAAVLLDLLTRKLGASSGNFVATSEQLAHCSTPNSFKENGSTEEQRRKNAELREQSREVLAFLNEKTGRSFRFVDTNLRLIEARLRSGATVSDCKGVVARKCREWKSDAEMVTFLRPATLFSALKFEQYLGEKERES